MRDEQSEKLTQEAVNVIAGLTQLGGALMAFGNRTDSSFIRLSQGKNKFYVFSKYLPIKDNAVHCCPSLSKERRHRIRFAREIAIARYE